jgi:ribosomal protein S18 acetylase RimI-like enzyme
MTTSTIATRLIAAVAAGGSMELEAILAESAVIRIFDEHGIAAHRPAAFVAEALLELRGAWMPESLEFFQSSESDGASTADFRVQLRSGAGIADLNGAAILTLGEGKVSGIALYLGKMLPSMQRFGIVRADMTDAEREAFIEAFPNRWDFREFFPPNMRLYRDGSVAKVWTNVAHPGSNYVRMVHWTAEEADQRIEEVKQWYRARGLGIQWTVGPFDSPPDLRERLERAGFVLAGDQALMARYGLEHLDDIPANPEIEVINLQQARQHWEASLQINATAFQWSQEQTDNERDGWFEDLESEPIRSVMALVDGQPVADAHLYLQSGVAYLGGAATLPAFRNRKIYSTLLRRRLEIAREEVYEVAVIHAEPMSRRVVSRFGFETQAMYYVYGWMEPMDLEVIRTLVQDQ